MPLCIGPTCPKTVQGPAVHQPIMVVYQTLTTTMTAWDVSASSLEEATFLGSLKTKASASLDKGSFLNDFGSARSIGSHVSGSFGLFLQAWQWIFLVAVVCCCCGVMCLVCGKRKKSSRTREVAGGMDADSEADEDEMGLLAESNSFPPLILLTAEAMRSSPPNAYSYRYPLTPKLSPSSSTYSYPMVARQTTPSEARYPAGNPAQTHPGFANGYPAQGYTYSTAPTYATYG